MVVVVVVWLCGVVRWYGDVRSCGAQVNTYTSIVLDRVHIDPSIESVGLIWFGLVWFE